jgi:hypothetical protein
MAEFLNKHLFRNKGPLPLRELRDIARGVNVSTGRGQLGKFGFAGEQLGSAFFSPRNTVSWPQFFADWAFSLKEGNKVAAAIQLKSLIAWLTISAGFLKAYELSGHTVEWDWLSSDFMKIKDGDQRFDIMGGGQQWIVALARGYEGKQKNAKGKVEPHSWGETLGNFITNRSHPALSAIGRTKDVARESLGQLKEGRTFTGTAKDEYGNEFGALELAMGAFAPIMLESLVEAIQFEAATDQQYLDAIIDTTVFPFFGFGGGRYRSGVKVPALGVGGGENTQLPPLTPRP